MYKVYDSPIVSRIDTSRMVYPSFLWDVGKEDTRGARSINARLVKAIEYQAICGYDTVKIHPNGIHCCHVR